MRLSPSDIWEALPRVLSLSPEMGSGVVDMASSGWGSLGRDGDLLALTPHLKWARARRSFVKTPEGDLGRGDVCDSLSLGDVILKGKWPQHFL
jgi:hypothetical protein